MSVRVSVDGADRLAAKLTLLRREAARAAREALAQGAGAVAAEASARAPKRTGRLAASIEAHLDADGLGATIGSDLAYAAEVEFGTRRGPAQPFLLPAFEALRPAVEAAIAEALAAAVAGVAGR